LGAHARAGADRYSLSHPHAVTLNIAGAAPCQRPRTQDARQCSIAGPLSASRLTSIRRVAFASYKLVCAGVRLSSCSAHLLPVALSPWPGGPCFRNAGIWFRRNRGGHHQHLRSLSLLVFQATGPMRAGVTQSFCPQRKLCAHVPWVALAVQSNSMHRRYKGPVNPCARQSLFCILICSSVTAPHSGHLRMLPVHCRQQLSGDVSGRDTIPAEPEVWSPACDQTPWCVGL